jgi:hypothetical protein
MGGFVFALRLPQRGGVVALALMAAALSGLASSGADDPELDGTITYRGEVEREVPVPDGDPPGYWSPEPPERFASGDFGISCTQNKCRLVGVNPRYFRDVPRVGIPIVLSQGRGTIDQKMSQDPCDDNDVSHGAGTMQVEASGDAIRMTWIVESRLCSDVDGVLYVLEGVRETWSGAYASGDPCMVEPSSCASSPTPSDSSQPTPSAGGTAGTTPPPGTPTPIASPTAGAAPALDTPSILSTLPVLADSGASTIQVCVAVALALILVLLIAFPTALLNSAVERAVSDPPHMAEASPPRHLEGWRQAGLAVAAAAVISGFVHPDFGVNPQSVRVLASIAIAFVVEGIIGSSVLISLVRRAKPDVAARFVVKPFTLLIVVGAVIVTRVTHFEPAIIFGLVAGVTFSGLLTRADRALSVVVSLGYGFAIALLAWVVYSALRQADLDGGDFGFVFVTETLASFAIAGVAALPIVLVPLYGLPGYAVFTWKKMAWGASYFAGLFCFFVLLMPMPEAWDEVPLPLVVWVSLYVAYSVIAVVAWLIVRAARPKPVFID